MFRHLKENYLSVLLIMHEEVEYKLGNVIFKEGDEPRFVYIIFEGEI